MNITCGTCGRVFDDVVFRTSPCPDHPPLDMPADYKYCRKHDFFNCPYCTPSERDAYGICYVPKDKDGKPLQ